MAKRDCYDVLGVTKSASKEEIKKAEAKKMTAMDVYEHMSFVLSDSWSLSEEEEQIDETDARQKFMRDRKREKRRHKHSKMQKKPTKRESWNKWKTSRKEKRRNRPVSRPWWRAARTAP